MTKHKHYTAVLFAALGLMSISSLATESSADNICGRKALAEQLKHAQTLFEKDCGFTIMRGRLPGDVNCGHGAETIGEAWDRALISAGVPRTYDEREKLASDLSLDPQASLVLMGMARAEGIEYLLKNLQTCE
ncbi:hypothetical protein GOL40_28040 [Sinorhizobium medicae]|nr:hypothetical protein [Sinorhizobium medicae]